MRSGAECEACAQLKFCPVKGVCNSCYSRNKYELKVNDLTKHKECKECKQVKFIHAQEMCGNCYSRKFQQESKLDLRKYKDCQKCGEFRYVHAQGMCQPCYSRTWSKARRSDLTKNKECKVCKKFKYCPSRGMCGACYARVHSKEKEAEEAKRDQEVSTSESDEDFANLSSSCSRTRPFKKNKVGRPPNSKKCNDCGEGKKLAARGLCQKCYKMVLTKEKEARDGITVLKVIKKRGRPKKKKVVIIKRHA
ncbi:hypothetical protein M3Y97_00951100 [Aphelenchoides bicaudatus]|nr:hypothetical protein M3Y97_00951100 [Aphelenchoides bicaudatus]